MTNSTLQLKRIRKHRLRPFTSADYPSVTALYVQHDIEFLGDTNFTEQMLREMFASMVNFDPETSVAIAEAADGTVVGAGVLMAHQPIPVRPSLWVMALPDWAENVVTSLLEWGIATAERVIDRVPSHARVTLVAPVHHRNTRTRERYEARGLRSERYFYTMHIEFQGVEPPAPKIPDGFRVVTFEEHPNIEDFARAVKLGFADHRGSVADTPLDYYISNLVNATKEADFDPGLFWLAFDTETGDIAGVCNTFLESDEFRETGFVKQLAVMPKYRKRGLASALLHLTFHEHFKRGRKGVSLGVDGASLTNAVAMYQRAGMKVSAQWDNYELELRPGEELSRQ